MSITPDAEPLESGAGEDPLAAMMGALRTGQLAGAPPRAARPWWSPLEQFGYAGALLTLAVIACVFAFPLAFAAAAAWWLAQAGWGIIG